MCLRQAFDICAFGEPLAIVVGDADPPWAAACPTTEVRDLGRDGTRFEASRKP